MTLVLAGNLLNTVLNALKRNTRLTCDGNDAGGTRTPLESAKTLYVIEVKEELKGNFIIVSAPTNLELEFFECSDGIVNRRRREAVPENSLNKQE